MDGKNIADFIDPDIKEKLEALEREEERLIAEGFYDSEEEMVGPPFLTAVGLYILTPNERLTQTKNGKLPSSK